MNIIEIFRILGVLYKYWPVVESAITAVETVAKALNKDHESAMQDVVDHLTPGKPNSEALSPERVNELTGSPAMNQG